MTQKKTIIKKGYTLTVKSWENDGDNDQTNSETFETLENALIALEACRLCRSTNNNAKGIYGMGNMCDTGEITPDHIKMMKDFFEKHDLHRDHSADEDIYYDLSYLVDELVGSSEFYLFRVFESAELYYSANDVVIDLIDI